MIADNNIVEIAEELAWFAEGSLQVNYQITEEDYNLSIRPVPVDWSDLGLIEDKVNEIIHRRALEVIEGAES